MAEQIKVRFSHVYKSFGENQVLKDINLEIKRGEILALMGENGAGKSTLMKILSGVYGMDQGQIYVDEKPVLIHNPLHARDLGICTVYQELSFIPTLSTVENLFLGRLPQKNAMIDWAEARKEAKALMAQIGMDIDIDVPMRLLTAAQRQMVEITRVISLQAQIIIMDEPTSSLSKKEVAVLFDIIRNFRQQGITTIFISHKLDEVFSICDRIVVMKDGEVSGIREVGNTDRDEIITMMVGRQLKDYYPSRENCPVGEVCLEVNGLTSTNGIENISFQARSGEILGIAGLVGSGRTEVMRALFSADKRTAGTIKINGKNAPIKSPGDAIRYGMAFATEDRRFQGLVLKLGVKSNLSLACLKKLQRGFVIDQKKEAEIADQNIRDLRIRCRDADQSASDLSGGNQQKIVVGKWLNTEADIYIFDEPTKGIDVGAKSEIYQLMDQLARNHKCVIMVSSELPEILGISDRILVMCEGQITGELSRSEATENRIMSYSIGGGVQ